MKKLVLVSHAFDDEQAIQAAVAAIRTAGSVSYVNAEGASVDVTIGDVTVEQVP
jgi:hypothetical protein